MRAASCRVWPRHSGSFCFSKKTAQIVSRKDHAPTVTKSDPLQVGRTLVDYGLHRFVRGGLLPGLAARRSAGRNYRRRSYSTMDCSFTGILSSLWSGKMAAISRRNDSLKARLARIESASSIPPRSMYCFNRSRSLSGQAEGGPTVHKNQVVVDSRVGNVEQFFAEALWVRSFNSRPAEIHQIHQGPGRGAGAAGMAEVGHV